MAEQAEIPKLDLALTEADSRQLDAAYRPFPTFAEWSSAIVDSVRWDRYSRTLLELSKAPQEQLDRAHRIAVRAAAVDTGAIEGLYEVDRGFTFTVAMETAAWEAAVQQKGETARSLIEAQLSAYEYVVDFATKSEQITEAAIRVLHEQVVEGQRTYRVVTPIGLQEQPLPKGQYKVLPNHVRRRDGKMHSYAPADLTPAEMHRLVDELRSEAFLAAHPVLQASYAHYAFVVIHPFADGNGRVARALASVFMLRARSIPMLILADQREEYFATLEAADIGDHQAFVDFTLARALDAMQLVQESIRAAGRRPIHESLKDLEALYITKGGYTHDQVDDAGRRLFESVFAELETQVKALRLPLQSTAQLTRGSAGGSALPNYRELLQPANSSFALILETQAPAKSQVFLSAQLLVPKDCGRQDDLVVFDIQTRDLFAARIDETIPSLSSVLQIRIKMFVEGLLTRALAELATAATKAYRAP